MTSSRRFSLFTSPFPPYNVAMSRPSVSAGLNPAAQAQFATTHWSLVVAARDRTSPQAREALATLCRTYWYPLYAFIRRQGYSADQAQDLTQEFFARLLEKDFLSMVDREKGKFRSFLLACCKHFLANERDRANAQKRGGGCQLISVDFSAVEGRYRLESSHTLTPERSVRAPLGFDLARPSPGEIAPGVRRGQERIVRSAEDLPHRREQQALVRPGGEGAEQE